MNLKIVSIFAVMAALFAGCETSPEYTHSAGPYVKPGLVMIPADQYKYYQNRSEGSENPPPGWSAMNVNSVQTESEVTAIQFNRYPDPGNKNLMHEAHIVYRRDNQPQWKLQPSSSDQQILVGPQTTEGRGELKPVQSQGLETYLREQRTSLARQQKVMASVAEGMRELAQQQQSLAREVAELKGAAEQSPSGAGKSGHSDAPPLKSPDLNSPSDNAPKAEHKAS